MDILAAKMLLQSSDRKQSDRKQFEYMKSPDGEDIAKKLGVLLKPAILTAFMLSTCNVYLYSKPKGYLAILGKYLTVSSPVLGGTAAFVLGHNLAGSVRKANDSLNWFVGGAAAGIVWGIYRKSAMSGFRIGIACGALAAGLRKPIENDCYTLLPKDDDRERAA